MLLAEAVADAVHLMTFVLARVASVAVVVVFGGCWLTNLCITSCASESFRQIALTTLVCFAIVVLVSLGVCLILIDALWAGGVVSSDGSW